MSHLTQPPLRQNASVAIIAGLALILAAILAVGQAPALQAAPAATLYVNGATGSDSNNCLAPGTACATIGAAIAKASDDDTIQIAAGTYFENSIDVDKQRLTINGAGAETTIVDGGQNGRIFNLYYDGTLSNLTVQNGRTPEDPNIFNSGGGAIRVGTSAHFLLQNVVIQNNLAAGLGGAIFNTGNLTVHQSILRSNQATHYGGAIYHYGVTANSGVTITQSLIESNVALGMAGGGISVSRNLFIQDSTIRDNESTSYGGGVHLSAFGVEPTRAILERSTLRDNRSGEGVGLFIEYTSLVTMTNVTVSGNVASSNYAGIYAAGPGTLLTLRNSTVADNRRVSAAGAGRGGLLVTSSAAATLYNSIIANNQDDECAAFGGTITSLGHNLSSDATCELNAAGDQPNTDPLLMPLGDYGGATLTHALRPGSPAIDAGNNTNCPVTDQRGVARPYDGNNNGTATCDVGAVEAQHQLTIADVSVVEGTGGSNSAVFTVTLSSASSQAVTVNYATQNDSAAAPADFTATSGTLTFSPGQTVRTIAVPIVTDSSTEPDETFFVQLSNPANAVILIGTATGTILNDDGLPTLNIGNVSVAEGNSGTVNAVFNVALSLASDQTITVNYTTQDDSAAAPDDYTTTSGSLTFTPGQTNKQITVPVKGDNIDEGESEQFRVVLSSPINAVLGTATGTGTITDDDTARLNLYSGPAVVEGDSGTKPAIFTVTLSTPTAFVVTVDYEIVSGFGETGATAGEDFVGQLSGTLTFQPGETTKTFGVDVVGDTNPEPNEEFRADIKNASVPIVGSANFITILDDDTVPVLDISDVTVNEGNSGNTPATFVITMTPASLESVTVNYATQNASATAPDDFIATNGSLTFAPGETSKQVTVQVKGDVVDEGTNESFQVVLSNPVNATLGQAAGTGTITDDDSARLTHAPGPQVAEGNSGNTPATFSVTLSTPAAFVVNVDYAVRADVGEEAATPDVDFTVVSGTLTFQPGQTTKSYTVQIIGDTETEQDETFLSELSNANVPILVALSQATILNDDSTLPTLRINDVSVDEGESGTVNAVFTVSLTPASGQTVTVDFATQNDSATTPADYTAASGTLAFAPGETSKQITVQVNGDMIDEGESERFRVVLSNPANASVSRATGIGTIVDNDSAQIAIQAGPTVVEGNTGTTPAIFTVTLSTPASFAVTVDYEVRSGEGANGAVASEDFTGLLLGTVTFQPGQTTQNFSVDIIGDSDYEGDETFTAHLSNGNVPVTVAVSQATILNDDEEEMYLILLPLINR